jgi:membrane protease YdiL (CAAX protease family)
VSEPSGSGATLAALGAGLLAALGASALVRAEVGPIDSTSGFLAALATAPLLFAIVALADPRPRAWLRGLGKHAPFAIAALPAGGLFLLQEAGSRDIDPFALVVTFAAVYTVAGVLNECSRRTPVIGPADGLAFVALWVPLDLRWYRDLAAVPGDLSYAWWSLVVSFVAIAGWAALRDVEQVGYRLPRLRDLQVGLLAFVGLGVVLVPLGLATGYLDAHAPKHAPLEIARDALGVLVLIALPEELLFRGVLDGGLRATLGRPWVSLVASSVLFGLSHWPRANSLNERVAYCSFASIAGLVYGLAYRRSDGLAAPILTHTLVDVTWHEVLHK